MSATETVEQTMPLEDLRRERLGVMIIARRLHLALKIESPVIPRCLKDVAFLQSKLAAWNEDQTHFGKAVKQMVLAAIGEAATDKRLTDQKT